MIYFIPTPIGNLDDISVRSLKLLAECKTLFCEDTRITKRLLSLLSQRHNLEFQIKNFISMHSHNENAVLSSIDKKVFEETVGYLSDAGMPGISDPGSALVRFCQENTLPYEILPGANAALLAYVTSGIETHQFLFYGFLSHKGMERQNELFEALNSPYAVILYESPHRIEKLLEELTQFAPERKIFAIKEATKLYEKRFLGTSLEILQASKTANLKGEWVVVITPEIQHGGEAITKEDLIALDLPPKQKAKLLSKLTGESIKEWYIKLQN
ncbi:16S rRNA (cytidine(1402)-2'-O)-methyltransferase [Sulfurospirillum sp.]|uniref:16S rRNA (cytidine(1402)-2'-O)-methyltransferase n=1 Tax=Sulfurospirillum sp. TaxID=2053622 RepID=UPI002FDD3CCC